MRRRLRSDQRGMTLPEVLIVSLMCVGLLLAMLGAFDAFILNTDANSRLTNAQDTARSRMDQMTRVLRNAAPTTGQPNAVLRAQPTDVVIATPEWPGGGAATTSHRVRYCLGSGGTLYWEGLKDAPAATGAPGAACPSGTAGWTSRVVTQGLTNTAAVPVFRFNSPTPSLVRSIGIELHVNASGSGRVRSAPLRSAVFLRSRSEQAPVVGPGDVTSTCNGTGGLLQLGLTTDSNGDPLRAEYIDQTTGLKVGSGPSLQLGAGARTIGVKITNVLGLSTLLTKQVSC